MSRLSNTKMAKSRTGRPQGVQCGNGCGRSVSCHQRRANRRSSIALDTCRRCTERYVVT